MKTECSIVKDLLPLYAEDMLSGDTADFVAGHLKSCGECQSEYERIKEPKEMRKQSDISDLKKLKRKLKIKRIKTAALSAVFAAALLVSAFALLGAPEYKPYSKDLVTVEPVADGKILLSFDQSVGNFKYDLHDDPDDSSTRVCEIEAWTTLWDGWFSNKNGGGAAVISGDEPIGFYYLPNDGGENIYIAKYDPLSTEKIAFFGEQTGVITLPRLVLGYYLVLAAAALGVMIILRIILRKKPAPRLWAERIGLYPAAYIISHFIVAGFDWASYSASRDFALIVFLSVLLYGGLLLLHNILYLRKEIKAFEEK